jgi:hypothetical protein
MIPDELRALYPTLTEDELATVKENLDQYLLLAWDIVMNDYQGDNLLVDPNPPSP